MGYAARAQRTGFGECFHYLQAIILGTGSDAESTYATPRG